MRFREIFTLDDCLHDKEQRIGAYDIIWIETWAATMVMRHYSDQWPISNIFGSSLGKATQDGHFCHENNLLSMDIFIVGKLKYKNGSCHMALPQFLYSSDCHHTWLWWKWNRIEYMNWYFKIGMDFIKPYMDTHPSHVLCSVTGQC